MGVQTDLGLTAFVDDIAGAFEELVRKSVRVAHRLEQIMGDENYRLNGAKAVSRLGLRGPH